MSLPLLLLVPGLVAAKPSALAAEKAHEASAETVVDVSRAPKLRVLVLDPKKPKTVLKVNTAPGLATVIQLPEPWAVLPTCGDCVFGEAEPKGQLYRLDAFPETRTLSIKPTRLPGADLPGSAFITNIDVSLVGGISATLFVELTMPEQADARVELVIPEAETSKARLTQKERELEDGFSDRVKAAATHEMLTALIAGTSCKDFFGRPTRSDGIVVRLVQLCRNGALVYVTFEVENRKRSDMALGSATLVDERGGTSTVVLLQKEQLRFNERTLGIAAIERQPGVEMKPSPYTLTVSEDAGLSRQVEVAAIEF